MNTIETQVVIVGGAVAGSSLACALAHRGIQSVLIEKHKTPTDLNRGDGMQPRSLEILEAWGALAAFEQAGAIEAYGIELHHPFLSKLLEIDLGVVQTPHPHLLNLPHPDIEALLLKHAQKSAHCQIHHGTVNEVIFEANRAVGVQASVGGQTLEIRAPVIAGADGAASTMRKKADIEAIFHEYDHDLLVFHAKRPDWFSGRVRTRVYLHWDGAVILLPLPDMRMRIAILVPSGTGGRWKTLTEDALRQHLANRHPDLKDLEALEKHGEHIYRMRNMHAISYTNKGVVLLGDAIHLTHAAGGLGMNMALQDAETLADELASAFQEQISLELAYRNYERIRRPINQAVIERAEFMSRQLWTPSKMAFLRRSLMLAIPRYLLPFVSQRITYSLAWRNAGIPMPASQHSSPFPSVITQLYRLTDGALGGHSRQNAVLLLTTYNQDGHEHTVPLLYFTEGEHLLVVASHGGSDYAPHWLLNLQRDPRAIIQIRARKFSATATLADQEQRNALWPSLTKQYNGLEEYQKRTSRQIPVVFLQSTSSHNSKPDSSY